MVKDRGFLSDETVSDVKKTRLTFKQVFDLVDSAELIAEVPKVSHTELVLRSVVFQCEGNVYERIADQDRHDPDEREKH
jgi:hypothetical protein